MRFLNPLPPVSTLRLPTRNDGAWSARQPPGLPHDTVAAVDLLERLAPPHETSNTRSGLPRRAQRKAFVILLPPIGPSVADRIGCVKRADSARMCRGGGSFTESGFEMLNCAWKR